MPPFPDSRTESCRKLCGLSHAFVLEPSPPFLLLPGAAQVPEALEGPLSFSISVSPDLDTSSWLPGRAESQPGSQYLRGGRTSKLNSQEAPPTVSGNKPWAHFCCSGLGALWQVASPLEPRFSKGILSPPTSRGCGVSSRMTIIKGFHSV